jgi:Protein of unknown function (DUF1616)
MTGRRFGLVVAFLVGCVTVATASTALPPAIRIPLGVLIVFVLPGFAAVCALFPESELRSEQDLFAALGISLTMTTCVSVALSALPVGLSRESFAVAAGGATALVAVWAAVRSRRRRREVPVSQANIDLVTEEAGVVADPSDASPPVEPRWVKLFEALVVASLAGDEAPEPVAASWGTPELAAPVQLALDQCALVTAQLEALRRERPVLTGAIAFLAPPPPEPTVAGCPPELAPGLQRALDKCLLVSAQLEALRLERSVLVEALTLLRPRVVEPREARPGPPVEAEILVELKPPADPAPTMGELWPDRSHEPRVPEPTGTRLRRLAQSARLTWGRSRPAPVWEVVRMLSAQTETGGYFGERGDGHAM